MTYKIAQNTDKHCNIGGGGYLSSKVAYNTHFVGLKW